VRSTADARTSRLRRLCRRHHLTWRELADLTGRQRSTVRAWLNGGNAVPADTLALLELRLEAVDGGEV